MSFHGATTAAANMIRRLSKSDKYDVQGVQAPSPEDYGTMRRPIFTQPHFDSEFDGIAKEKLTMGERIGSTVRKRWHPKRVQRCLLGLLPVVGWLRNYDVKRDLLADVIAGVTVAIFHVPQSFGYSILAGVPAVNGLYTAMFPMLMYTLFGTSKQLSIGAFAVVCMMTGTVVGQYGLEYGAANVASSLMFFVGLYQLFFGALNLGGLSVFLSEQFVSGFTAGVSVHIGSSQLGSLFGYDVGHFSGPFLLIRLYTAFFEKINTTHLPTLGMSCSCIFLLLLVKLVVDPYVERKIRMPVPIEMILVIAGTLLSRYMTLEDKGFAVIDNIPRVFPMPTVPDLSIDLVSKVAIPALAIAIVSFAITVSLGRIFARRHGDEIVPNQEFLALGMSNLFGSFFGCFPCGASVPRSSIQDNVGGRTQLVSLINSALIAIVLLYLGSYLEKLPVAVLAAIIFVSLKKVFMQVRDFINFWRISKIDGYVWLVTFFATVVLEVQLGLIIGVVFSLLTLVYKIQRPKTCLLGYIPNTDYYVPLKKYGVAKELGGIKVFHFGGPLHFANAEFFRAELSRRTFVSVSKVIAAREKNGAKTPSLFWLKPDETRSSYEELADSRASIPSSSGVSVSTQTNSECPAEEKSSREEELPRHIILDFSRVTFIDGSSAIVFKQRSSGSAMMADDKGAAAAAMARRLSESEIYGNQMGYVQSSTDGHGTTRRPVFTQPHFESEFDCIPKDKTTFGEKLVDAVRKRAQPKQFQRRLLDLLPIIGWLGNYSIKGDLLADVIAGVTVAIFHLFFGILNLGGLSVFLSEQFVSGFTAGVSVHIGSSQLGSLFGFDVGNFSGPFMLIRIYISFFGKINTTHLPTLGLSSSCVFLLLLIKLAVDPFVERKIRMPIPTEMILVIAGTLLSRYLNLEDKGFDVIDDIPDVFPTPAVPDLRVDLVSKVAVSALTIALVSFAITVSLGRIFARRHGDEIAPNQEFLALGMSNLFGSFFGCIPSGASVPRSSIQDNVGGRTQLVSLINSALIAIVLLYLGSYLEKLPVAVLAAIIFVSLKKVFMQVRDFINFWKFSKIDGYVWLVTFFSTIILEVQLGLVIGVVFSLLTLVYKIQRPKTCLLGHIPNTDYYVPLKKYGV
ncbi:sulfate transporter, putative, partial [Ixodes scapularis]